MRRTVFLGIKDVLNDLFVANQECSSVIGYKKNGRDRVS